MAFRDLYRNAKGDLFVVISGLIRPVPIAEAVKAWPRATSPVLGILKAAGVLGG